MRNYFNVLFKLNYILNGYIYKNIYKVLLLTTAYGLSELFGIAILIPIIKAIFSETKITIFGNYLEFKKLYFFSFLFFVFKFLLNDQYIKYYFNFIFYINKKLHSQFIKNIEQTDYINLISSNKNSLKSIIANEIDSVTYLFLMPFFQLTSDLILLSLLFVPLFFINIYSVIFFIVILLLFYLCYKYFYSFKFVAYGNLRRLSLRKKNGIFSDFLAFFKNIKINNLNIFNSELNNSLDESTALSIKLHRSQTTVKAVIELLVVLIILFFSYSYYISANKDNSNSLPYVFIFYALISLRIVPIYSRSITNLNNLKFSLSTFQGLLSYFSRFEVDLKKRKPIYIPKSWKTIRFESITFHFPGKKRVLGPFNIEIKNGKTYCIVGPSGSGKTTFINIISGLLLPSSGNVYVNSKIINPVYKFYPNEVFYLSQESVMLAGTLRDNITLGNILPNKSDKFLLSLLQSVGLGSLNLDEKLNVGNRDLSGGEKQKICIARALYLEPKLLILDEPTSSLDNKSEIQVTKLILKLKKTSAVIMVTHNMSLSKFFDFTINL